MVVEVDTATVCGPPADDTSVLVLDCGAPPASAGASTPGAGGTAAGGPTLAPGFVVNEGSAEGGGVCVGVVRDPLPGRGRLDDGVALELVDTSVVVEAGDVVDEEEEVGSDVVGMSTEVVTPVVVVGPGWWHDSGAPMHIALGCAEEMPVPVPITTTPNRATPTAAVSAATRHLPAIPTLCP